ncbi:exopolyphosphatase/guanosine-5'-triphosphate,3'-diphosphate pyrophosphatase [Arcanobacterium wilhelmae]|uniref:Exopolyphosphatase/guanosine-5'-triphosphate, 3'-diphosphate pyrophosphatase n=1 Tax=Arcanobacterium wilhelmae TaxID=1803177 RepID=A0ABT9NCK2_9ACTO|nr:exopolyphosphatase [Arcanobacterium wilhelmae]MDP9801243.1 exopolyphosphatase/guanosine-5'-triphosphate,3'-diphosphate pyrophosphatase [Arcanobacterium wilhelmae]WFN90591.1 exopolyphosphatase [Arcanobacterium wilhelmae]
MRVAGIDCGTNTIRLLIADVPGEAGAPLADVVREMEVVRLGQGVDRTGQFDPQALERTLVMVDRFAAQCREHGVESVRFAATSATRDASNRAQFIDGVRERLGVEPQVITGEQEAAASFSGAISVLPAGAPSPLIAVDLGGGSTELALGTAEGEVLAAFSMNVGSVRMRERHLVSDPPTAAEVAAARADVNAALDEAEAHVDLAAARGVIGLAGTVTTVTAQALGLDSYQPQRIHGAQLSLEQIEETCEWFIAAPFEKGGTPGYMHPGRVDVIGAGALVWEEVVKRIAARTAQAGHPITHVVTSEHDILDGLALWAAREPQAPQL